MTTNGEWLDYLANNAPDELSSWFDAERVETEERALDGNTESDSSNTDAVSERYATAFKWLDRLNYGKGGVIDNSLCDTPEQGEVVMPLESWREHIDTEPQDGDSRDKLEADVRMIAEAYNMDTQRHGTERFEHELYYSIIHLLDRQAAITEEQTRCKWVTASADEIAAWRSKAEKLQAQVYELTTERDKLQDQLHIGWECECRLQAERERYREKFGKCIDYADAIHALMDDEGLA